MSVFAFQLVQVRQQLERLRNANTKLLAERDAALERAAKAEEVAAAQADEAEAARMAVNNEVVRLTTTTEQQGKLINHLLSLLPPDRRMCMSGALNGDPVESSYSPQVVLPLPTNSEQSCADRQRSGMFMRSRSRWLGGGTKSSTGHSALFLKTRSVLKGKKGVSTFNSSHPLGGENEESRKR